MADVSEGAVALAQAELQQGQPPKDRVFYARHHTAIKWTPYRPNSQEVKRGKMGRWQELRPFGIGWQNTEVSPEAGAWVEDIINRPVIATRAAPRAMDREAVDAEVERIMAMSDDEIMAEADADDAAWSRAFKRGLKTGQIASTVGALVNALEWYRDQVSRVRMVHSEGEAARNALDKDCGKLATEALSTLSADAIRQGEGATARNCRVVGSDLWRHVKRGTVYEVIGTAELQASQPQLEHAELVIYQGADGKLWARNSAEFHDGRFVTATPASHASDGGKA